MRIVTLYSGSEGNSVYIEAGDARILVDAGRSARYLCNALHSIGSDIELIDAIFITHEHSDHVSALETLTKKHKIPIHIAEASAKRFDCPRFEHLTQCFVCHEPIFEAEVCGARVRSCPTPHDSNMSVCYRIDFSENGCARSIAVATDIGYVTDAIKDMLVGCEAAVLESNHDVEMLTSGPYPYDLKKRILSKRGHLSNADSAQLAAFLAQNGTRGFILAHLSKENNEPDIALDEFLSCVADPDVFVAVAERETPTEMILKKETSADDISKAYSNGNA